MSDNKTEKLYHKAIKAVRSRKGRGLVFGSSVSGAITEYPSVPSNPHARNFPSPHPESVFTSGKEHDEIKAPRHWTFVDNNGQKRTFRLVGIEGDAYALQEKTKSGWAKEGLDFETGTKITLNPENGWKPIGSVTFKALLNFVYENLHERFGPQITEKFIMRGK